MELILRPERAGGQPGAATGPWRVRGAAGWTEMKRWLFNRFSTPIGCSVEPGRAKTVGEPGALPQG